MDSEPKVDAAKVQLLLNDRLIQETPFAGSSLRIGRMKENDLVVNNLAVSRFHAVLHRTEPGGFELEDLGSENGTFVNGTPVDGRLDLGENDEITIGKHTLRVSALATGEPQAPAAAEGSSDVWDASQTYFAQPPAGLVEEAATDEPISLDEVLDAEPVPEAAPAAIDPEPAPSAEPETIVAEDLAPATALGPADSPDPEGVYAFGEDEVLADAMPVEDGSYAVAEPDLGVDLTATDEAPDLLADGSAEPASADPEPERNGEHTALFDFGAADDLGEISQPPMVVPFETLVETEPTSDGGPEALGDREGTEESIDTAARAVRVEEDPHTTEWSPDVEAMEAARPAPDLHAGWIIQRDGRLEGVVPWDADTLAAGRSESCEIVLGDAGVSRTHATFVRTADGYQVQDADSVNGTWVNGERVVGSWALRVGDMVRIEDFELTFVLDHQPVGDAAQVPDPAPQSAGPGTQTVFGEKLPHDVTTAPVVDLVEEDDEDEGDKELELSQSTGHGIGAERSAASEPLVRVDIEIPRESLPASVRLVLEEAGEDSLRLPAEVRIRLR